jgi:hypothetical protein
MLYKYLHCNRQILITLFLISGCPTTPVKDIIEGKIKGRSEADAANENEMV